MKGQTDKQRGWIFQSYEEKRCTVGSNRSFVRNANWKLYTDGSLFKASKDWHESNTVITTLDDTPRRRLQPILERAINDLPPKSQYHHCAHHMLRTVSMFPLAVATASAAIEQAKEDPLIDYAYATMSDGVKIAPAISYPKGFYPEDHAQKWPAILEMSGYRPSEIG